jgi:hypothetical protein
MSEAYKPLNIIVYPLNGGIDEFDLPEQNNFFPVSLLSSEIISFFESNNIFLSDTFNISKINVSKIPSSHAFTDGNYQNIDHQRFCGINWNFSYELNPTVKFFTTEGATPTYNDLKDHTEWDNVSYSSAEDFSGFGPILLNPQSPYVYSGNVDPTLVLSLSFKESWESINQKLENYIIT